MGVSRVGAGFTAVVAALAAVVVSTATDPSTVQAAPDPPVPVAQVLLNDVVYDRYEPVIVDIGTVGFFPSCPNGGVRDYLYPWADLYIIRGSAPAVGATLIDVNGKPNTIAGFGGGGYFDEVIGYGGVNGLLSGTYSIVVDECQDKKLDANDAVFPGIFRVTTRTSVDPLLGIGTLKANAGNRAVGWEKRGRAWSALLAMEQGLGYASAFITNPPMMAIGIGIANFAATQISGLSTGVFPDPKKVAAVQFTNMGRHYRGIESDPPDPNYAEVTTLGPATVYPQVYEGSSFASAAALSTVIGAEEALTAALLRSIERYQGAAAQGDGTFALLHARQAQEFARLLASQLLASTSVLEGAAQALEADPRPIEQTLDDIGGAVADSVQLGLTGEQEALIATSGVARGDIMAQLNALLGLDLATFTVSGAATEFRDLATTAAAFAADLEAFATSNQAIIDGLVADPFTPDSAPAADAGGPYVTTAGLPTTFDATATGAGEAPIASYHWDLDGDGAFDDGVGATLTADPGRSRLGLVGVLVTDDFGAQDASYAQITVNPGPEPSVTSSAPDNGVEIEVGSTQQFEFSTTIGTVTWFVDGTEVATGPTFDYSPTLGDIGTRRVEAIAVAGGTGSARDWSAFVSGADDDSDGYPVVAPDSANNDCDDNDPVVYPGAPELLDGKDNDCNPASPDGGIAPTTNAGDALAGPEGSDISLTNAGFDATGATGPFTATVSWGDGTSEAASVSGTTVDAVHVFADNGVYPVEVCVTSSTALTDCASSDVTVSNVAATPDFATLHGWTVEELPSFQGVSNWVVESDGLSVLQTRNSRPSFFVSDQPLIGTEASVSIGVETTGDDDFVGFVLGFEPNDTMNDAAKWILLDWKQNDQGYFSCGGLIGDEGLAVSYVEGIPDDSEVWTHSDCDTGNSGNVTELARAATLGDTGWVDNDVNLFRFVYTSDSLQIFVDNVLEFDLDMATLIAGSATTSIGDVVGGSFPEGNLGFYNYSQDLVRYAGFQVTALTAIEGTARTVNAVFIDAGTADTHTGRFDFGDGEPVEAAIITETDGAGTAATTHTYAQQGDYNAQLCITDDDDGVGCQPVLVRVANAAPVVDAGRDRTGGPTVEIDDAIFTDAGINDTHTATIDWGDGSAIEPVAPTDLTFELGRGGLASSHTYAAAGTFVVTACVTDDAGDTGCDTAEVTTLQSASPVADTDDDAATLEGVKIERGIGFVDANTSDTQTVTVDWGDGTSAPATVQARPGGGSGILEHTYLDNGVYAASFEVCDDGGSCDTATSTVTVGNQSPVVNLAVVEPPADGLGVSLSGGFTDPGSDDTHVATINWGDGSSEPTGVSPLAAGGVVGSHVYATAGNYVVELCVTDDDGGVGCATSPISLTAAAVTTIVTTTLPVSTVSPVTSPPATVAPSNPSNSVSPPNTISGVGLPSTGSAVRQWLSVGLLAILLGALAIVVSRRRNDTGRHTPAR